MTPILADSVSHRTRFAWLVAAVAASVAAAAAVRPAEEAPRATGGLGLGRCQEGRRAPVRRTEPPPAAVVKYRRPLPNDCVTYEDRLLRLAGCPQLPPETRRALRSAWEQAGTSWPALPEDARHALADGCRMGISALDEAAAAISCDIVTVRRVYR